MITLHVVGLSDKFWYKNLQSCAIQLILIIIIYHNGEYVMFTNLYDLY